MDRMIRARFVEGLRSGLFLQGRGALRLDDKYCCLGVLCEIVKDDLTLVTKRYTNTDGQVETGYGEDHETGMLPVEVANYTGLDRKTQERLVGMNDEEEVGFDEIADWIEENL